MIYRNDTDKFIGQVTTDGVLTLGANLTRCDLIELARILATRLANQRAALAYTMNARPGDQISFQGVPIATNPSFEGLDNVVFPARGATGTLGSRRRG